MSSSVAVNISCPTVLPSIVINILGYCRKTIYGLASDKVTYIKSVDNGMTWTTVTGIEYNTTTSFEDWIAAVSLPWVNITGTFDNIYGYTQNGFGGEYWCFCSEI